MARATVGIERRASRARRSIALLALGATLVLGAPGASAGETEGAPAADRAAPDMVRVAAGAYLPLYGERDEPVRVDAFLLDRYPVTNGGFLAFVRAHPKWRRDRVAPLFAEEGYLSHWAGSSELGPDAPGSSPVTKISWFAARAYCASRGKRLPTLDEWELAARASADAPDATGDPAFDRLLLDWYARPTRLPLPPVGSTFESYWGAWDLHGLVWEWVEDFNAVLMTGASRKDASIDRQLYCAGGAVGSVDPSDYAAFLRYAMRGSLEARYAVESVGFRCAKDAS